MNVADLSFILGLTLEPLQESALSTTLYGPQTQNKKFDGNLKGKNIEIKDPG